MSSQGHVSCRVLVVDDDPSVLCTYRRLLRRAGLEARAEGDPRRVLDDGNGVAAFDLIVIDYKMPGMDGLSFLAELRRRECRARCILISAFLNDDLRDQARVLGVDRVLDKPVDVGALRDAIAELTARPPEPSLSRRTIP